MALVRPSCLKRCSLCPGSAQLCESIASRLPVEDPALAKMGTDCHALVAMGLTYATRGDDGEPRSEMLGMAAVDAYLREIVGMRYRHLSGYDLWATSKCLIYAMDLINAHGIACEHVLIEHHMDGADLGLENGGTADLVLVVPFSLIVVVDWKFGHLDQGEAELNDQLAGYAAMAGMTFTADQVHVHIVQPKLLIDQRATSAAFDARALRDAEAWTRAVAAAAQDQHAPMVAGLDQCFYCDALLICGVAKEFMMDAMEALELFGWPETAEEWGDLIEAMKLAERFAKVAKDTAKAHLMAGGQARRWTLRDGAARASIDQAQMAWQRAQDAGLEGAFIAACKVAVGDLREQLGPDTVSRVWGDLIRENRNAPSIVAAKKGAA